MLIGVRQLGVFWGVRPTAVLHVGAHEAEELTAYQAAGWKTVTWVEGLPDKALALQERLRGVPGQEVLSALAWDRDGDMLTMHRANNGQSSSALPMGTHSVEHPDVHVVAEMALPSSRLDTLLAGSARRFDFLNLDIQGAELQALRGLGERLRDARWIYAEVNTSPLYVGGALVDEIDAFLEEFSFRRVDVEMTAHGWGDALYIREDVLPRLVHLRRALRKWRARTR